MNTRYFILSNLESDKKSVEKFLSLKPDQIMKDVIKCLEVYIMFEPIRVIFVPRSIPRQPEGKYDHETKTIYIREHRIERDVLQHEFTHAVMHQFFSKRMPRKWDEMIAMAVDRELQ